jgi:hypothetical protein
MSLKRRLHQTAFPSMPRDLDPETAERHALLQLLGECQVALRRGEHPRVVWEMIAAGLTVARTQEIDTHDENADQAR